VKRTFLTVIVFIAAIAFLALFLADQEMQAGIRRLSNYRFSPRSALDANPGPRSCGVPNAADSVLSQYERAAGNMFRRPSGLKIDWEWQPCSAPVLQLSGSLGLGVENAFPPPGTRKLL